MLSWMALLPALAAATQSQTALSASHLDTSNHLFRSLAGLLRSWPQAFAPSGQSIVPATVSKGTLLYHVGNAEVSPKKMEWLAFDAELSYLFSGKSHFPPTQNSSGSAIWAYTAEEPLRVLYFDGMSASKGDTGSLDTQDILVDGRIAEPCGDADVSIRDYERAERLCAWAAPLGVQGIVRQEAVFELMWCNFSGPGLKLVGSTKTSTVPRKLDNESSSLPPGHDGRPPNTRFFHQRMWSVFEAASRHAFIADARIKPHPAYLTSLYDSSYPSLVETHQLPVRQHGLSAISPRDVRTYRANLESALTQWRVEGYGNGPSEIDWSAIAQAVQGHSGVRLAELNATLSKYIATGRVNARAVAHINIAAFPILMPYVDGPSALTSTTNASSRAEPIAKGLKKCKMGFTGHLPRLGLSSREVRLVEVIETVSGEICGTVGKILEESMAVLDAPRNIEHSKTLELLVSWKEEVEEIMKWLGWSMWQRCSTQCAWDERCLVDMWPVRPGENSICPRPPGHERDLTPRCVGIEELLDGELV